MNTIKKDGSKLLITVDKNTYYYDYKDNSYVSEHGNKIKNSTIKSKLSGLRLRDFDNENTDRNYFELLKFINSRYSKDFNIGSLLEKLKYFQNEEKFYCLGIYIQYQLDNYDMSTIKLTPQKIKFLIMMKDKILYNKKWMDTFKNDCLFNFTKELYDMTKDTQMVSEMFNAIYRRGDSLEVLLDVFKYDKKSLINYLFRIGNSEGLHMEDIIGDLKDYAYMSNIIQNGKYNKYPRFLLSTHAIVLKNYDTYRQIHDEELFGKIMAQYDKYKYKYRKYAIGIPTTTKNILNEGTELRHCVASYIKNILNGQTAILFMRETEKINEPLITIEFKDGAIIQAKGLLNRKASYIKNILNGQTAILFMRETEKINEPLITIEFKDGAIIQAKGLLNRKPNEEEEKFIRRFAEKFGIKVKSF